MWEQRYIYRSACAFAYSEKRLFISCFGRSRVVNSQETGKPTRLLWNTALPWLKKERKWLYLMECIHCLTCLPIMSCSTKLACVCYEKCMKTSLAVVNNLLDFYLLEKETLMPRACMQQTYTGPCMHIFFFHFYWSDCALFIKTYRQDIFICFEWWF